MAIQLAKMNDFSRTYIFGELFLSHNFHLCLFGALFRILGIWKAYLFTTPTFVFRWRFSYPHIVSLAAFLLLLRIIMFLGEWLMILVTSFVWVNLIRSLIYSRCPDGFPLAKLSDTGSTRPLYLKDMFYSFRLIQRNS